MFCPFCNAQDTKVVDSRLVDEGIKVRRRRCCTQCNERFTTYEIVELNLPRVVKSDGRRADFEVEKLKAGMRKALEKRPVGVEALEASVHRILQKLRASGERELSTQYLGECVMEELRNLDEVAYVRFASVYRQFQDINAFAEEIRKLEGQEDREFKD